MIPITTCTAAGTAFAMLPPHATPAPTLLLLALSGAETLSIDSYVYVGRLLYARGWNIVSLDLPCHGADCREGEPEQLAGWAARTARGEDIVAVFQSRVNDVIEHLVASGTADPCRIAAAGTSRGGFMALHAAAGNPRIRAVAAFAPVTDLHALREFAGQEENPLVHRLTLEHTAKTLVDRAVWLTIGNRDERVGTEKAIDFVQALIAAGRQCLCACNVTLHVVNTPGHESRAEWHDDAAAWLLETVISADRMLPASR